MLTDKEILIYCIRREIKQYRKLQEERDYIKMNYYTDILALFGVLFCCLWIILQLLHIWIPAWYHGELWENIIHVGMLILILLIPGVDSIRNYIMDSEDYDVIKAKVKHQEQKVRRIHNEIQLLDDIERNMNSNERA